MSRSGYSEDYDEQFPNATALYESSVMNAIYGKRGQKFMRELVAALDAIPEKRLIAEDLVHEGAVCAMGAVGLARGMDMTSLNPEDAYAIGAAFGIAPRMAREIAFENDESGQYYTTKIETPGARWQRMRNWAAAHLKSE